MCCVCGVLSVECDARHACVAAHLERVAYVVCVECVVSHWRYLTGFARCMCIHVYIYMYTWVLYIYIYIYVCVCVVSSYNGGT